jgi:septal ring factor EnvC (AmiA/AmiB activator)
MNPADQRKHTTVTTELAKTLQELAESWDDQYTTVSDRLDLHQREIAANERAVIAVRQALERHEQRIEKLLTTHTEPMRRDFLGRCRWFFTGV